MPIKPSWIMIMAGRSSSRTEERRIATRIYPDLPKVVTRYPTNTKSHISVITQLTGSIWLRVLPHCIFNVMVMLALHAIDERVDTDIKGYMNVSNQAHRLVICIHHAAVQWSAAVTIRSVTPHNSNNFLSMPPLHFQFHDRCNIWCHSWEECHPALVR